MRPSLGAAGKALHAGQMSAFCCADFGLSAIYAVGKIGGTGSSSSFASLPGGCPAGGTAGCCSGARAGGDDGLKSGSGFWK
jgi:hypothetical protein